MNSGITYVAFGKCIEEAERSAYTASNFNIPTCLITNENYTGDKFDKLVITEVNLSQAFNILNTYDLTPWDVTLWLDSDTLILDDLSFAFKMARRFGIAAVLAPHSSLNGRGLSDIPGEAPEYNCGATWIDKNHKLTKNLGDKWAEIVSEYDGEGWWTDQSSLSYALYKLKINPYILPLNWNFRAYMDREFDTGEYHTDHGYGSIKIWHSRTSVPLSFNPSYNQFWKLKNYRYYKYTDIFKKIIGKLK